MSIRQERIRDLIHERISYMLRKEVTDPALRDVTVTRVEIDREIEYADVWVNALGEEKREKEVMQGLKRASGFLRKQVASSLRIRNTPVLHFHWDHTLAEAEHIENLLDSLRENKYEKPDEE